MSSYMDKYFSMQSLILEDEILNVYQQARKEIDKKLSDFNKRHAAKNAEMQKKLKDGTITQDQYKQWLTGQIFIGNQWKQKAESIDKVLLNADKEAAKLVHGKSIDVFAENANYTAYEIEKDFAGVVNFGLYDRNTVSRYLRDNPKTLPEWKIDEPKDYVWNQKKVQNAVLQGIIQGEGIPEISKRMARDLSSSNARKMTLFSRTAMTGAQNSGRITRMEEAEEQGIEVNKQWIATLDDRTRDTHQELDGQIRKVDEPFEVDGMEIDYPGDPNAPPELVYNCRCSLRYVYPGIKQNRERRAYRINEETGKRESYIVGDVSYKEWKNGKIQADEIVIPEQNTESPKSVYGGEAVDGIKNERHREAVQQYLDSAPDIIANAWNFAADSMHAPQFDAPLKDGQESAFYRPRDGKTHYSSEKKCFEKSDYQEEYSVYFHEYGHNIDNLLAEENGSHLSDEYKNGAFGRTIRTEIRETLRDYYVNRHLDDLNVMIENAPDFEVLRLWSSQSGAIPLGVECSRAIDRLARKGIIDKDAKYDIKTDVIRATQERDIRTLEKIYN